MPNVVAVIQDDRVRKQVDQFLGELDVDDLRFATFATQKEFEYLYFRDRRKEALEGEEEEENQEPSPAELKLFSEINLFIFAMDTVDEKPSRYIDHLKANMIKFKSWPGEGFVRIVLLKYEEDGVSKLDVMHPLLDDLIYLPLDRLVFLQKLQILASLPKKVSPRYLFNQEVNHSIEISKIVKMDRVSDVALAMRNPVPLRKGLPGHFYIDLPGEKFRLEVRGKVLGSTPHPDVPGQYLVYFAYFGLTKSDLTILRRFLSKAPRYQSLQIDDRDQLLRDKDSLFDTDTDKRTFGVTVVDSDEATGTGLSKLLRKEMDKLQVTSESSFYVFLHKYLDAGGKDANAGPPPKHTDLVDFYSNPITLSINSSDLKCVSVSPSPNDSNTFLGHPALALFSSPDKWLQIIQEKQAKLMIEEAVQLVLRGRVLQKLLSMADAQGQRRGVNFRMYRGANENLVNLEMTPATVQEIMAKLGTEDKGQSLEALVIDTNFVPDEPEAWIEGVRTRAVRSGMSHDPQQLKFILISDNEARVSTHWLNSPDVHGLIMKPVDSRQLLFLLSEMLPNKNTLYRFDNLGWAQPMLPIHVAKNVELEAISEYGATIRSLQKIPPGTMIYLRRSIYDNAPGQCLAARVYACQEHPKDKTQFQIYATYFGITDGFLKYARTWIRENYTQQKSQGSQL